MRASIVLAVLAVARVAGAEPCQVTYARAPADVQKVIESWVRAEPRCVTTLELRVIPTDGGLYLMARDGNGRTHERLVPDAQSAGVLVASWIADDSAPPPPGPPATVPTAEPPPAVAPLPAPPEAIAPAAEAPSNAPGATAPAATAPLAPQALPAGLGAPTAVTAAAPPSPGIGRWLSFGVLAGGNGGGVRGELDLAIRGKWSLGAALAVSSSVVELASFSGGGWLEAKDVSALATLARTTLRGRWSLRLVGGVGLVHTSVDGFLDTRDLHASGVFATAEASALVARRIFARWALATGVVATWHAQEYRIMPIDPVTQPETTAQRAADAMFLFGVRRRM